MSITFFIPDSPQREVIFDEGTVDEYHMQVDVWPSINMANSNAWRIAKPLCDKLGYEFDHCGSWTPEQCGSLMGVIHEVLEDKNFESGDVSRYLHLYQTLSFASTIGKEVYWG